MSICDAINLKISLDIDVKEFIQISNVVRKYRYNLYKLTRVMLNAKRILIFKLVSRYHKLNKISINLFHGLFQDLNFPFNQHKNLFYSNLWLLCLFLPFKVIGGSKLRVLTAPNIMRVILLSFVVLFDLLLQHVVHNDISMSVKKNKNQICFLC